MYFKRYRNCHVQKPLTSAEGSRGGERQRRLGMQLLACIVLRIVPPLRRQLYSIFRRVYSQLSQLTHWMSEGLGPI